MIKKTLVFLLVALIVIQFFHPKKNINAATQVNHISSLYATPENVNEVLKIACNDCHSNNTVYPWYSKIQPVDWWMNGHVKDGKGELNFDEFATYSLRRQYHKMDDVMEQLKKDEMPLNSYTWIHKNAILTSDQKQALLTWAAGIRKQMEGKYPMDSLVKKTITR